jgi:23S rRNA-/tRNA-specific pseudouridylate synthase
LGPPEQTLDPEPETLYQVLYEDEGLIAVLKTSGMAMNPPHRLPPKP